MNERIKEFAEQAGHKRINDYYTNGTVTAFTDIQLQKFSELIVRDCVNKIETYQIPIGNSAAGEMACEWTYDALKEIRDDIKEHFGVEE